MQRAFGGMQPPGMMSPDFIAGSLAPIMNRAAQLAAGGLDLNSILRDTMLAAFLAGGGLSPTRAVDAVEQWRVAGAAGAEQPQPLRDTGISGERRSELAAAIERFMQDQATAAIFYSDLMERTQNPRAREYIRHAMEDEQKHYRLLGALYRDLTGRAYEATPQRVTFANLAEGVMRAMDDEYEAFEEYRDVYLNNADRRVRDLFFELMTDELEHATRFDHVLRLIG